MCDFKKLGLSVPSLYCRVFQLNWFWTYLDWLISIWIGSMLYIINYNMPVWSSKNSLDNETYYCALFKFSNIFGCKFYTIWSFFVWFFPNFPVEIIHITVDLKIRYYMVILKMYLHQSNKFTEKNKLKNNESVMLGVFRF